MNRVCAFFLFWPLLAACQVSDGDEPQPTVRWSLVIAKSGQAPSVTDLLYDAYSGYWSGSANLEQGDRVQLERAELGPHGRLYAKQLYGGGLDQLHKGAAPIRITEQDEGFKNLRLDPATLFLRLKDSGGWGIIGSATPGGWDRDTDMKYDKKRKLWSVTLDLKLGEFKFRLGDSWATNLGGQDLAKLVGGGGNYRVGEAGKYTVTLDPIGKKATIAKL